MASFPTSIKSFTTKVAHVTTFAAAHINDLQDEVVALETFLLPGAAGTVVFNEAGIVQHFRAEGDNDANLLYLDGTNDRVGIGTATPTVKFDVAGPIKASTTVDAGTIVTAGSDLVAAARVVQATNVIRAVIKKTGIADNSATNLFTITCTNEGGSNDGGVYSCAIHAVVAHGSASNSAETSCMGWKGLFARATNAAGAAGANSAMIEAEETAVAASAAATKTITVITGTIVETSEYVNTIQILVDMGGTTVTTADVTAIIELVYIGFATPPVIAAA
jgi:hypothetical protein